MQKRAYEKFKTEQFENPKFRKAYEENLLEFNLAVDIAKLRQQNGLSQTEVAALVGTSPSVISRLENGENVELKTLLNVLRTLNATLKVEPVVKKRSTRAKTLRAKS